MEKVVLVRNLGDIDIRDSQNVVINPETVIGELRVSAELAAQISARARAGLAITLEFLAQERENGFYLIAGSIGSIPVAVNKVEQPEAGVTVTSAVDGEPEKVVQLPEVTLPGETAAPPQGDRFETLSTDQTAK